MDSTSGDLVGKLARPPQGKVMTHHSLPGLCKLAQADAQWSFKTVSLNEKKS